MKASRRSRGAREMRKEREKREAEKNKKKKEKKKRGLLARSPLRSGFRFAPVVAKPTSPRTSCDPAALQAAPACETTFRVWPAGLRSGSRTEVEDVGRVVG